MVSLSVLYPASSGTTFDWDYYLGPHIALAKKLLAPRGLLRIEISRGVGGFPSGAIAPYYAIAHLYFPTMQKLQTALGETAADLITDQKKYYNGGSVVQVNDVIAEQSR
jgi:uncharacterized protein (TIGR02118 family)